MNCVTNLIEFLKLEWSHQ